MKERKYHTYTVTVTVKHSYLVDNRVVENPETYEVEVQALNAAEAVRRARQYRRDEEGRYAASATYKAKRLEQTL